MSAGVNPRGAIRGGPRTLIAAAIVALAMATSLATAGMATAESVSSVAAGGSQNCALLTNGSIKCWGANFVGNLGNGTTSFAPYPVLVSGISDATSIDSGVESTCAVHLSHTVSCWGRGTNGELGDGNATNSSVPVQVSDITDATAVSLGDHYACALQVAGTISCWGAPPMVGSPTPVAVPDISNATAISTGSSSACALMSGGTIKCWGLNTHGQLGAGIGLPASPPVPVVGIADASAVAVGDDIACAVEDGGTNSCWGNNFNEYVHYDHDAVTPGPVTGCPSVCSSTPVADDREGGLTTLTAGKGGLQFCGIRSDAKIVCWGWGELGQLGNGQTPHYSDGHVAVADISSASTVSAGFTTCAVWQFGSRVSCWGTGTNGQLGNGVSVSAVPVDVVWGPPPPPPPPSNHQGVGGPGSAPVLKAGKLKFKSYFLRMWAKTKCPKTATLTVIAGSATMKTRVKVTKGVGPNHGRCFASKTLSLKGRLKSAKKLKFKFYYKRVAMAKGWVSAT